MMGMLMKASFGNHPTINNESTLQRTMTYNVVEVAKESDGWGEGGQKL